MEVCMPQGHALVLMLAFGLLCWLLGTLMGNPLPPEKP